MRHFHVTPAHPVSPARAQSLESRFLGRKPRCVPLRLVLELLAIGDLVRSEKALGETLAMPVQHAFPAERLRNIDPGAHDHLDCSRLDCQIRAAISTPHCL